MASESKTAKVRVLIVDDSAYNRQTIAEILASHPDIEVVGKAADGEEGLKAATLLRPDLITLDLEMPRMDGFTFLRIIMSKLPTPIIVISSHSRKQSVFQALELGALDFIAKPTRHISPELQVIREELIAKVLLFRQLRLEPFQTPAASERPRDDRSTARPPLSADLRIVAIGASTGGPPAIQLLLKQLDEQIPAAIVVAQHMPAKFTRAFAERLDKATTLAVSEAEDGVRLAPGHVYIAPGGTNMTVERSEAKRVIRLTPGSGDDRYIPSIDKLFVSVAELFAERALGIVLTGMGTDGKAGAERLRAKGGVVIAESRDSAVIFGMPKEVIDAGAADIVLPLSRIAAAITDHCADRKKT